MPALNEPVAVLAPARQLARLGHSSAGLGHALVPSASASSASRSRAAASRWSWSWLVAAGWGRWCVARRRPGAAVSSTSRPRPQGGASIKRIPKSGRPRPRPSASSRRLSDAARRCSSRRRKQGPRQTRRRTRLYLYPYCVLARCGGFQTPTECQQERRQRVAPLRDDPVAGESGRHAGRWPLPRPPMGGGVSAGTAADPRPASGPARREAKTTDAASSS